MAPFWREKQHKEIAHAMSNNFWKRSLVLSSYLGWKLRGKGSLESSQSELLTMDRSIFSLTVRNSSKVQSHVIELSSGFKRWDIVSQFLRFYPKGFFTRRSCAGFLEEFKSFLARLWWCWFLPTSVDKSSTQAKGKCTRGEQCTLDGARMSLQLISSLHSCYGSYKV